MSTLLEQLRSQFKKNESGEGTGRGQSNYYRFYDMPTDETATVRFLGDKNKKNPFLFFVEKKTHRLVINGENKTVPCLAMYGEDCPICAVSRNFYKQKDEDEGKKYYRKISYITQALIKTDPIQTKDGEESAVGKVKLLSLDFKLYNVIRDSIVTELDEVPYAYEGGTDFNIKKTKNGKWNDYTLSKFARRSTDLDDETIDYCEEHAIDLSTALPAHPGLEKVQAMLKAALNDGVYDEGNDDDAPAPVRQASTKSRPAPTVTADDDDAPWEEEKKPASKTRQAPVEDDDDDVDAEAAAIMAAINRKRQSRGQ